MASFDLDNVQLLEKSKLMNHDTTLQPPIQIITGLLLLLGVET